MILIHPFWQSCPTNLAGASSSIGTISTNNNRIPHYGLDDNGWSAWILTAAEVNGAKQIEGIGYVPYSYTTGYQYPLQVIKMAHVVQSSWPTTTPALDLSDLTVTDLKTVKGPFTETITNGIVNKQTFTSNFCYNGTSNLLIIWENRRNDWSGGYGSHQHVTAIGQGAYKTQNVTYPTGNGTRLDKKPYTTLYY